MPAIKAMWSYGETGYHSLAAIVVEERYPREAMKFAFRILGEDGGQLNLTKFLVVIDRPLDLGDFRQVLAYALARAQLATDLFVIANLAMDTLDYTGPAVNQGSKGNPHRRGRSSQRIAQRIQRRPARRCPRRRGLLPWCPRSPRPDVRGRFRLCPTPRRRPGRRSLAADIFG